MTDEELSKLIREFLPYPSKDQHYALRSFAKLVAAAEREACVEEIRYYLAHSLTAKDILDAIRERGAPWEKNT